ATVRMRSHITSDFRPGREPKRKGNRMDRASSQLYEAKDTGLMIAAGNRGQHERLFTALGRPDIAKQSSHEERERLYEQQTKELEKLIAERTADEWEQYLQSRHVPAGRVRSVSESPAGPPLQAPNVA